MARGEPDLRSMDCCALIASRGRKAKQVLPSAGEFDDDVLLVDGDFEGFRGIGARLVG